MTQIDNKSGGIPVCAEDENGLHRYRAIISAHPVYPSWHAYPAIVPENYGLEPNERNPSAEDIQKYIDRYVPLYGQMNFCRKPDSNSQGEYAIFADLKDEPKTAGHDQPYEVPFCADSQFIVRTTLTPINAQNSYFFDIHHMMQPLPQSEVDFPQDENSITFIKGRLPEFKAAELCQREVSDIPKTYALFMAFNRNPDDLNKCFAEENNQDSLGSQDFLGSIELNDADMDNLIITKGDPSANLKAYEMASNVEFFENLTLTTHYRKRLEIIFISGLKNSISESELMKITHASTENTSCEEEFIYTLATLTSLLVAKKFDKQNIAEGGSGISSQFEEIASTAEEAILRGDVRIEVDEPYFDSTPTASAAYDIETNTILYQPIEYYAGVLVSHGFFFEDAIHECVHLYQDTKIGAMTPIEEEAQAYKIDSKASLLSVYKVPADNFSSASIVDPAFVQKLKCMGYDEEIINFVTDLQNQIIELEYENSVNMSFEMMCSGLDLSSQSSKELEKAAELYRSIRKSINNVIEDNRTISNDTGNNPVLFYHYSSKEWLDSSNDLHEIEQKFYDAPYKFAQDLESAYVMYSAQSSYFDRKEQNRAMLEFIRTFQLYNRVIFDNRFDSNNTNNNI